GINYADYMTTLSPPYAQDIQHPEHGEGLEGLMQWQSQKLMGLVHGPDTDVYCPTDNQLLSVPYTADDIEKKADNKRWLQEKLGLPVQNVPLIALPGPLTSERGMRQVLEVLDELMNSDLQLVVLGAGEAGFEEALRKVAREHPEKCVFQQPQSIDWELQLFAASDFFLATPFYEPRGMNGLEAVYFGSLPIVRLAGGYRDTMIDFRDPSGDGFAVTFTGDHGNDLLDAIHAALMLYEKEPTRYLDMARKAMSLPYSWDQTADAYLDIYRNLMKNSG
ncbi:MAG: glycosyltransferase, partial [Bacillota bacterium]|nr:glycosyltransferase [Bacillota bacterium]